MASKSSAAEASGQGGSSETQPEAPSGATPKTGGVVLAVTGPINVDSFTVPASEDTEAVTFDRNGTRVLKGEADDYVTLAAMSGVYLSVMTEEED